MTKKDDQSKKTIPQVQRQSIEEATAEAESRPMDFNPADRAQYVRTHVQDVARWVTQGESEEAIKQRVPQFVEQYPELFKKLIQKQDMAPIQGMLSMLDRMAQGNISQHQASIIVGKKLVDRFVTPQLKGDGGRK
jgi:hypothetical protein